MRSSPGPLPPQRLPGRSCIRRISDFSARLQIRGREYTKTHEKTPFGVELRALTHRHRVCPHYTDSPGVSPAKAMKLPYKILVLDDDDSALDGIVEMLREMGYAVTPATTYE